MIYYSLYCKGSRLGSWDYSERKGCLVWHDHKFTEEEVEKILEARPELKIKETKGGIRATEEQIAHHIVSNNNR